MKIGTYNVRNLYDPGTFVDSEAEHPVTEEFFTRRIDYFVEKLRPLDLDIICFQEIGGEKGITMIADALTCDFFLARPNKRGIRMGVLYKKALASQITCESVSLGDLYIPAIQERGDTDTLKPITQRRDILEITLRNSGKTISINTFHLKSNLPQYLEGDDVENDSNAYTDGKFRCILYKTMELRAIKKHVVSRLKNGNEVMLLGDYNENNTASLMDILKGDQLDELRLDDVLTGYEGDVTTHYHRGGKLTFDTILVSQGLKDKVKSVRVENSDLVDCSMLPLDEDVVGSDHAPVWCEIDAE